MSRATRRWVAAAAVVVSLAACGGGGSGAQRWPDVEISDATGAATTSGAVLTSGRPAIVTIWGITCAACKEELPRLQAIADREARVDIAAVNLGDDPGDIAVFAADLGLSLTVYIDTEGRLAEALGVASLPATVFVAADGTILERHLGALSAGDLESATAELLGAPA